jgi:hypothetical protein
MAREHDTRRELLSFIGQDLTVARPYLIQKNPYFPDLLNQPDFLVVPQLGRLVSVHVYSPREKLTWRNVLAAVEDLFELKLVTGESTVVAGRCLRPIQEFLRTWFCRLCLHHLGASLPKILGAQNAKRTQGLCSYENCVSTGT